MYKFLNNNEIIQVETVHLNPLRIRDALIIVEKLRPIQELNFENLHYRLL